MINKKIQVEEKFLRLEDGLFQKILLVAAIKSVRFYGLVKDRLCPYEQDRQDRRPDFTVKWYNNIYTMVARWWDQWIPQLDKSTDYEMSLDQLEEMLRQEVDTGQLNPADAQAWFNNLKDDYAILDYAPDVLVRLSNHPLLAEWLNKRAAMNIIEFVSHTTKYELPTLETLVKRVVTAQASISSSNNRLSTSRDLRQSMIAFQRPQPLDLDELNKALGGGVRMGETMLVAGVNGAGKTTLAMQFALHLAKQGLNVVVFTTERPPGELFSRALSNFLKADFSRFTNRKDMPQNGSIFEQHDLPLVPEDIQRDYVEPLKSFEDILDHLYFVDWTNGAMSLYSNFDQEIAKIENTGWMPNVVVFDWIGGGLDSFRNTRLEPRFIYKEAIEVLISHGKRNKRFMLVTAQLNKSQATNNTRLITMNMLAECKNMTDNVTTFVGISAMVDNRVATKDNIGGRMIARNEQFLTVDKSTLGLQMLVKVERRFNVQQFIPASKTTMEGGQSSAMDRMVK